MIIYCIQNLINGKKYIGQSSKYNSNEEFQQSNYQGSGKYIKRAIKKYGLKNFKKWVMIKNVTKFNELNKYETLYIKKFKTRWPNGYNLTDGGEGFRGNHSKESKLMIGKSSSKRIRTENWKNKISAGVKKSGKHSPESYKNFSKKMRGRTKSYRIKICIVCHEEYKPKSGCQKTCNECMKIDNRKRYHSEKTKELIRKGRKNVIFLRKCQHCGKMFDSKSGATKICLKCKKEIK